MLSFIVHKKMTKELKFKLSLKLFKKRKKEISQLRRKVT